MSARTTPRSGLLRERLASRTVTRTVSVSSGRTGLSQRNSSIPGEPRLALLDRYFATSRRIVIAAVCQPLAIRPPYTLRAAASGSV